MKFTAQDEYSLRCLIQVAREPRGLTIHAIAEREALTTAYVAKLLGSLRKAGLVRSSRGQNGGYQLSRPPEEITMDMVFSELGSRLYPDDFCGRHAGNQPVCAHDTDCAIRPLLAAIDAAVQRILRSTRLSQLLGAESEMNTWTRRFPDPTLPLLPELLGSLGGGARSTCP